MKYDVIVVGGGMAGLSLTLGLAQKGFKIAVIEARNIVKSFDQTIPPKRVSAINSASQALLNDLDVWHNIADTRINNYVAMDVWDQNSTAQLYLKAEECSLMSLGAIVENDLIVAQLYQSLTMLDVAIFEESKIVELTSYSSQTTITLDNGTLLEAVLIVGADGADSFIRQQYGFDCTVNPYHQYAIVANVKTAKPHQNIAYQRFLKNGVLALLPLSEPFLCSIVYSIASEELVKLSAMDDEMFNEHLSVTSDGRLGQLQLQSKRMSFELIERHVDTYYKQGVVLIADAAHTMHPLAGQGINLGFADVRALIDVLTETKRLQRNIADVSALAKYARKRQFDNQLMIQMMQGLKKLFCNDHPLLRPLRALGVNAVNKNKWLKRFFIEHAVDS
ncbi:UbiH/UbiF/VisC/COQ6 family ubiquinone biosynthesis hydroxylase [Cysteiniphilum halobium]|uniref:UbiH/UbiF/VisC/COQ6 family ubiquinone biosynthesis hydroxylase n=1 Tax=Cysteiniphilum halobium TaxID=2219059 RepID=UPI000E657898|nr:UbiH/UbiF/VisC/COQ6 family ubiquinone biosynthesis hydroxylase [Cysteiniphilum halobium]